MSILDDAIREHLELKRAHGADAAELKKLEDEAFGLPARPDEPDPFAEAPTEFLAPERAESADETEPGGRRIPNIADLQEAPPAPKEVEPAAEEGEVPAGEPESVVEEPEAPAEEEHPAMEHETVPEPDAPPEPEAAPEAEASHSTADREAIAEQPTEHFDVQAELESAEASSPSDEELVDAEMSEPRLAPVEPVVEEDEEDDDFFSEQRLSDELSQALDAPIEEEEPVAVESEELDAEDEEQEDVEEPAAASGSRHEDVLEDTPDFLEDTPEDDDLWFEQRPPKDFDFDD